MRKLLPFVLAVPLFGQDFHVNLRSRVEAYKGSGEWQEVQIGQNLEPKQTFGTSTGAAVPPSAWPNWRRPSTG